MSVSTGGSPYRLAIETSGRIGSVAIGEGGRVLRVITFGGALRHAVELLPTIDRLCRDRNLKPSSIAELYVSGGPGSFTGLRIGITVARMLSFGGGVRVVRVPTLDVIAQNALDLDTPPPNLGTVLDAKRNKFYAAHFVRRDDRYVPTTEPAERDPDAFFSDLPKPCALIGEGILYATEAVARSGLPVLPESTFRPRAEVVYRIGHTLAAAGCYDPPDGLVPIYVRRPEAEEIWEKRHAAPGKDGD